MSGIFAWARARLVVAGGAALIVAALAAPSAPAPLSASVVTTAPSVSTMTARTTANYEQRVEHDRVAHEEAVGRWNAELERKRVASEQRAAYSKALLERQRQQRADRSAREHAPAPSPAAASTPVPSGSSREIGQALAADRGWDGEQWECLDSLWRNENSWRTDRGGIPQAKPASKMASAGSDWQTNPATQITWGLGYIQERYGSPCGAWGFKQGHGWY